MKYIAKKGIDCIRRTIEAAAPEQKCTAAVGNRCPGVTVTLMNCGLLLLLFSGCGTLFIPKTVGVSVSSVPPGATITLNGDNVGETPAIITLDNSKNHTVLITHEQYEDGECVLNTTVNTTVVVADVLTSLLGIVVGGAAAGLALFSSTENPEGVGTGVFVVLGLSTLPVSMDAITGNWRQLKSRECNVELLPREAMGER